MYLVNVCQLYGIHQHVHKLMDCHDIRKCYRLCGLIDANCLRTEWHVAYITTSVQLYLSRSYDIWACHGYINEAVDQTQNGQCPTRHCQLKELPLPFLIQYSVFIILLRHWNEVFSIIPLYILGLKTTHFYIWIFFKQTNNVYQNVRKTSPYLCKDLIII